MRLNLNDNIKVKLTEHGKDIYYHQYDKINAFFGRELCKPSYPKVDEDGYTTFQLWCFMQLYGDHIGMALPDVIEPIDIVFDEPTIEPERKKGKWFWSEGMYSCDQCHAAFYETSPFCPMCGADMRGGQE